jgi:hypothetical protein
MARREPPSAKPGTFRLNKIDVAEAHIVSAVKLFLKMATLFQFACWQVQPEKF